MEQAAEWSLFCVDAGSAYCPCYLAESGECIACSLLRGKISASVPGAAPAAI